MYMICMHLYVFVASWYIVIHCTCIMHRCLVAKWSLYVMIMGLSLNNPSFFTTIHFYPEEKIAVLPFESFWHIPTKHQIQFTQVNISKYWRVVPVTKHSLRHSRECSGRALAMDKQLFAGTIHLGAIRIAAGGGSWMAMTAWSGKHEGHQHHVPVLLHLLPPVRHYFPRSSWCSCSIYFHLNLATCMMDYHPWGTPWFNSSEPSAIATSIDPVFGLSRGQNAPPLWRCYATHPAQNLLPRRFSYVHGIKLHQYLHVSLVLGTPG